MTRPRGARIFADMSREVQEDKPLSTARHFSPELDFRHAPKKDDPSHGTSGTAPSNACVTLVESLGPLSLWTYVVGFITICGSISFLIFLWSSDGTNFAWRQIAVAGWMPRCISLTSSILRVTISIQAACATSILAAILLEGFHVHILAVPALSMMRWDNSGPSALARLMWPNFTGHGAIIPCVIILALNTLVSQVVSTLLLTDVGQSAILSTFSVSHLPSYTDGSVPQFYDQISNVPSYWVLQPLVFPTIAEYHKQRPEQESGFYDTGSTFRGFLPVSNQSQRSILHSFQGTSAVMEARVICTRPELNFSVSPVGDTAYGYPEFFQVTGTLGWENMANSYYDYTTRTYEFKCAVPWRESSIYEQSEEWLLSTCSLGGFPEDIDNNWLVLNKLHDGTTGYSLPFLVFNVSGDLESWNAVSAHPSWKEQTLSEWKLFTSDAGNFTKGVSDDAMMGVTLCFLPTDTCMINISASGGVQHTEPRVSWITSNQTYNTEDIRRSLGATETNESISQRGHLEIEKNLTEAQLSDCGSAFLPASGVDLVGEYPWQQSTYFCTLCYRYYSFTSNFTTAVHPVISTLFNDITRLTGHPALALQAVMTVVSGMAYSDLSSTFSLTAPALVTEHVAVLAPVQWVGLPIVLAISAIHCILVAIILVVYARSQKRSIIGSAWSALGQIVQGSVMREWIQDCTLEDDSTISDKLKAAGEDNTLVGIAFVNGAKEVEIRRRRRGD